MSENQTNQATEQTSAPEVKLSRREKLLAKYNQLFAQRAKIDETLGEIVAEINSIDALASITTGSAVTVKVGKNGAEVEHQGVVMGVREEDDGSKSYKVQYGSGFDADVVIVKANRIGVPAVTQASENTESAAA